ncbi:MAG: TolC family protein [Planctomycetota bacterium]
MKAPLLVAGCAAVLAACQVAPPQPLDPPRPVPLKVLQGFELSQPGNRELLGPVHVLGTSPKADEEGVDAPAASIELEEVLDSVERHFPLVQAAQEEIYLAQGRVLAAAGGFDANLSSRGLSEVEGFYQSDRLDVALTQPTALWGVTLSGGYRLGQGDFAVYDGGKKTNEDGELRAGVSLPLLQGREIDPRRAALWKARIDEERAGPTVLAARLVAMRAAASAYWKWVSAGRLREVALRQLGLAEDRMDQLGELIDEGLLPPIIATENERLIVERQASLVRAELKLQQAAIALSLFWRDAEGMPSVPSDDALPYDFPLPRTLGEVLVGGDEALGLEQRPEVRAIELARRRLQLDEASARNTLLPRLDFGVLLSQDVGAAVNDPDDKGDFELTALLTLDVPLQRRGAKGRVREVEAKIAQLDRKGQFVRDKVVSEVQEARAALTQSWRQIEQARENVRLANELADAERFQLNAGQSDLLRVNLREQQAAEAAASLVAVLRDHYVALAAYRAVLGIPHAPAGMPGAIRQQPAEAAGR